MKNIVILFALLPLLVAAQCNPSPLPPSPAPAPTVVVDAGPAPTVDAGPSPTPPAPTTPVGFACANLAALTCSAGMPGCEAALQHMVDAKITTVDLPCLTLAKSKPVARACQPHVACP